MSRLATAPREHGGHDHRAPVRALSRPPGLAGVGPRGSGRRPQGPVVPLAEGQREAQRGGARGDEDEGKRGSSSVGWRSAPTGRPPDPRPVLRKPGGDLCRGARPGRNGWPRYGRPGSAAPGRARGSRGPWGTPSPAAAGTSGAAGGRGSPSRWRRRGGRQRSGPSPGGGRAPWRSRRGWGQGTRGCGRATPPGRCHPAHASVAPRTSAPAGPGPAGPLPAEPASPEQRAQPPWRPPPQSQQVTR